MAQAEVFDVSARKFHQAVCVVLLALGYVFPAAAVPLVALVGVVLLVGRYWWPADLFRQLAWRVLEPTGLLPRVDAAEDHTTRRVARVLGGGILLGSAVLLAAGADAAWLLVAAIGIMIFLDAAFDFCVLCEATYRVGRFRAGAHGGVR
jgi:hypothetical protein